MRILTRYSKVALGAILGALFMFLSTLAFPDAPLAPLTHQAALDLVAGWGPDIVADKIVALDWILRQDPIVTLPMAIYALKGADLWVGWDPAYIEVQFKSPFAGKVDPLDFKIPLQTEEKAGFVPGRSPWPVILGIAAASLGAVLSDEFLPLPVFAKQAAAFGVGGVAGAIIWLLMPG